MILQEPTPAMLTEVRGRVVGGGDDVMGHEVVKGKSCFVLFCFVLFCLFVVCFGVCFFLEQK